MSKVLSVFMKDGRTLYQLAPHELALLTGTVVPAFEGPQDELHVSVKRCYWDPMFMGGHGGYTAPVSVRLRYINKGSVSHVEEVPTSSPPKHGHPLS